MVEWLLARQFSSDSVLGREAWIGYRLELLSQRSDPLVAASDCLALQVIDLVGRRYRGQAAQLLQGVFQGGAVLADSLMDARRQLIKNYLRQPQLAGDPRQPVQQHAEGRLLH